MNLLLVRLIGCEYDPAIAFFTEVVRLELFDDSPPLTHDSQPKRWVEVRPTQQVP
ncbi:MAG: hypothetical protein ACJAR2_001064 [Ilumatobacter sp.]|jgi:hypothetical protein